MKIPSCNVLAAAVVAAALGGAGGAANALEVTGSTGFAGTWDRSAGGQAPTSTVLSFDNLVTLTATGIFEGYSIDSVKDLPLVMIAGSMVDTGDAVGALYEIDTSGGFDGVEWKTYTNEAGDEITFDLALDATWRRIYDKKDEDATWQQGANSDGVFEYDGLYFLPASLGGGLIFGRGILNASEVMESKTFQVTQGAGENNQPAVIPLPGTALLLFSAIGAIGAFRRRPLAA